MPTAVASLYEVLYDALRGDTGAGGLAAASGALLARDVRDATRAAIYNGVAPEGAALDFVVLGEPTEGRSVTSDALMAPGNDVTVRLHTYTADASNVAALAIYARQVARLDGVPLALTGHTLLVGRLTLETAFRDPDLGGRHLVARYRALTRAA